MKWLVGLVVVTAVPILIFFFVTRDRADLVYFLSEPIPLPSAGAAPERHVQQLQVQNVGNEQARDITVKIMAIVGSADVMPFAKSDDYSLDIGEEGFELKYPALSPGASMRVIFQPSEHPVTASDVVIVHISGLGRNALSKAPFSMGALLFYVSLLVYVVILGLGLRGLEVQILESRTHYEPKAILYQRKPIYVSAEQWTKIQDLAAESFLCGKRWVMMNIDDVPSYWLLNQDRPASMTDRQWRELLKKATEELPRHMMRAATGSTPFLCRDLEILLACDRPQHLAERSWRDVQDNLGAMYVSSRSASLWSLESYAAEHKHAHPKYLPSDRLEELLSNCRKHYIAGIMSDILARRNRLNYVGSLDLTLLTGEQQRRVQDVAYQLDVARMLPVLSKDRAEEFLRTPQPEWMNAEDYGRLRDLAEQVSGLETRGERLETFLSITRQMIRRETLAKERPDTIEEADWQNLLDLDSRIRKLAGDTEKAADAREKVLKQLAIIHEVLRDPSAFERVEEYDNPFAPGNFKNLKRVAEILTGANG